MAGRRRGRIVTLLALLLVASVAAAGPLAVGVPAPGDDRSDGSAASDPAPDRSETTGRESAATAACPIDHHPGPTTESNPDATASEPRIAELYPNPTTHGNVGEYLVVETPPGTPLANWTITDGHTTAGFPNETVSGRVAASTDPEETDSKTEHPIVELDGSLRLAVDGDDLTLRNDSAVVDSVSYDRAPIAERWYRAETDDPSSTEPQDVDRDGPGQWWPRDATCRPVSTSDGTEATTFVLPDAPEVPLETIREADDRLLLAGYTFTDRDVTDALVDATDRGVEVAVLLESGPVGGAPTETRSRIETLEAAGVEVRAIGGEGARYRFHHPKYVVADGAVLVTSENWKPAGVGGASSRGWGVRVTDPALAADLAAVFRADFEGWDTEPGASYLDTGTFVEDDGPPPREFDADRDPATVPVESVELLLAPDNAEARLVDLLASATDELLVKQASVDPDGSLLEETIAAAERGVSVRLLLDSSWYVADEHERLAADLDRTAAREDLDFEVRLADDTNSFEKIHAKGVVVDRETAIVGSVNWNDHALRENREVLLALHGTEPANYYAAVFEDDWTGETWSLPIGLSVTVVAALAAAAIVGRRYVRFGDEEAAATRTRD